MSDTANRTAWTDEDLNHILRSITMNQMALFRIIEALCNSDTLAGDPVADRLSKQLVAYRQQVDDAVAKPDH